MVFFSSAVTLNVTTWASADIILGSSWLKSTNTIVGAASNQILLKKIVEFLAYWSAQSWGWEGWGRLRFKDRDSQKRGTGLAQGGTEKEGGEPMRIIAWTRLCLNRLDTSWLKCGWEGNWIKTTERWIEFRSDRLDKKEL